MASGGSIIYSTNVFHTGGSLMSHHIYMATFCRYMAILCRYMALFSFLLITGCATTPREISLRVRTIETQSNRFERELTYSETQTFVMKKSEAREFCKRLGEAYAMVEVEVECF